MFQSKPKISRAIQAGHAALQRGDLAEARRHLKSINHPKAMHLLALVEKSAGKLQTAFDLLRRAAARDPNDAELANNFALLAQEVGEPDVAETAFRRALNLKPSFHQARSGLARLLIDLERWQDALSHYDELATSAPENLSIRYGRGTALLGLGKVEVAEALFDALIQEGHQESQLHFMRARCRLELGRVDDALTDLKIAHGAAPNAFSLKALAGTYWMTGNNQAFDALMREAAALPNLIVVAAEILRQSGAPEKALAALDAARATLELPADSFAIAASAHIDRQDAGMAETAARRCLAKDAGNRSATRNLVTSLLMQGDATQAIPLIEKMRRAAPTDQQWIAYEATALRLLQSERYSTLVDLERHVRAYDLPVPDGFPDIESFNAAFLATLEHWHDYEMHPLDQSLRHGSQTPRNLRTIDDPVINAFHRALDIPIRQYMNDVGRDADHPLTARNTGRYKIAGSWSVRLSGGGRHVNHVHPEGWISSAYYVSLPDEVQLDSERCGWIKFAEPPFDTQPASPPQKWICPLPGMLVLFPSFLWHGTQAIHDDSVRVTAAFDVIPD